MSASNKTVLEKLASDGLSLTADWLLHNSSAEPKPSLRGLMIFLQRLQKTNKDKKKSNQKQIQKGIAGQVGTYAYWLDEDCKIPIGQCQNVSHTPATTSSVPSYQGSEPSKAITRTESMDLRVVRDELKDAQQRNVILASNYACLELKVDSQKPELKRVRERENYYRTKTAKLSEIISEKENEKDYNEEEDLEEYCKHLHNENSQLKEEIKCLQETTKEFESKADIIRTFDETKKCYTTPFREMVYKLLQEHVGLEHVGPVIDTVLTFANKKAEKLPSEKTIRNMNIERLNLSQIQIGEEFSKEKNTTLYSDETSKLGEKYIGYHATDASKRFWVLGIRDLATKSAEDTLKTFKQVLQDIDDKKRDGDTSEVAKNILTNIQNTMSDRAATEMKWHEMLQNYRLNILPQVKEHWNEMTESERRPIERLRNFYCGLHSYVQIAETAGAALLELERDEPVSNGPQIVKANEPGTVRLIRTAAKAFARGADEKNGAFADFTSYDPVQKKLQDNGMSAIPIVPFRGNRFNIIFFNGSFVYFLHEEIRSFIEGRGKPNKLLQAVLADIKKSFTLAGCKAFGLISKLVMGPLWRIIENNNIHILDMGIFVQEVISKLEAASMNIEQFMSGNMICSSRPEWVVKKDSVFDCLISENKNVDGDVQTILGVVLPAITAVLKDHYSPLLIGDFDREQTESVVKHNKFAERVFAYTDQLLRFKPNIHHISQEAYIMFCLNKTAEWLCKKDPAEKESLISQSRIGAPKLQALYRQRRKEIKEERAENQRKKRQEEETRKGKQMKERETIFKDILYFGLYQHEHQLEEGVKNMSGVGEKSEAFKAQLRFREKILQQCADPKFFRFSEKDTITGKRRALTWQELKENCKHLIQHARQVPSTPDETSKASFLIGRQIIHKLVEKNDEHDENEQGNLKEYVATVISTVPGYPAWFNLKYEGSDDIYVEQLQQEMEKGNVSLKEN